MNGTGKWTCERDKGGRGVREDSEGDRTRVAGVAERGTDTNASYTHTVGLQAILIYRSQQLLIKGW